MKKETYINTLPYIYDPNHPQSHYLINGSLRHKNGGELAECITKHHRGLYVSDINPTTRFDKGSDIESNKASVKTSGFSLGRGLHGNTANELIKDYFARESSELFIYVYHERDTQLVIEYHMNKREFGAFIQKFAFLHYESRTHAPKISSRNTSKKMLLWLDERCE